MTEHRRPGVLPLDSHILTSTVITNGTSDSSNFQGFLFRFMSQVGPLSSK